MAGKTSKATKAEVEVIKAPDPEVIQKEYFPTVSGAKALVISNKEEHAIGLNVLKSIATAEARVKDLFKDPKEAAHKAHKAITEAEKKLLLPLADARNDVTGKILRFQSEERKKAEEEQKRLQEEARKAEEERQLADAIEAEAAGDTQGADIIMAAPAAVPVVEVKPNVAILAGVGSRTYYRCKIVSLIELVRYVASNPNEISLLQADETALRKRAESMKEGFKLPGCELDKKEGLSVNAL